MPEPKHTCPMCGHALPSSIVIPAGEPPAQAECPAHKIRILDCGLSTRAANALLAMSLHSLGEVCRHTPAELLKERGLGMKSLNEIIAMLASHGLALRPGAFQATRHARRPQAARIPAPGSRVPSRRDAARNHHKASGIGSTGV